MPRMPYYLGFREHLLGSTSKYLRHLDIIHREGGDLELVQVRYQRVCP
jgi:hypothetical protein